MNMPGFDTQRHIDHLRETLVARAKQAGRTLSLEAIDATHHIVNFQGAYWSVQAKKMTRKRWFTTPSKDVHYTFDIDFETLFLKPGKLVLKHGQHPSAEDFNAKRIKVEPILIQW